MNFTDLRRDYQQAGLRRADLAADPIAQFEKWFGDVQAAGVIEANAMTLATVSSSGQPAARMVLLKGLDQRGFHFFTHYDSPKGLDLEANPRAALVLWWKELERQVRVEGVVSKLTAAESLAYFQMRPRESRLGAWASTQSVVLKDRLELEASFVEAAKRFPDDTIPPAPNWGGYALKPLRVEFWQGRPSRLHDRFLYVSEPSGWRIDRLSP